MKMTNRWNRFIYRMWAPVYDATVNRLFMAGRRRALGALALQSGERVLLVGVGTGADLPLLPKGIEAMGIDLSPAMLAQARRKLPACLASIELMEGDAQKLLVPEESFDAAILNLILSVVPDGRACLQSTLRALKPGGRMVVFDKFQPDGERPSLFRRGLNVFATRLGTDLTRHLGDILEGCDCRMISNESSLLGGMYRVAILQKN